MFFLDSDDDGHVYLIPADKRDEWFAWFDTQDYADGVEPDFAQRINGPVNSVTFSYPIF